jgi:predicted nucleotidyltransferase
MQLQATYPTREHQAATEAIVEFFTTNYTIDAVLLVNSCARGRATRDSCLDLVVLAKIEYYNSSSHVSPIKS